MFRSPASIIGLIFGILLDPFFWAAIVLWIMYAKRKIRGLKIGAIVCFVITGFAHIILIPLSMSLIY